jgi:hypothetical protein
VRVIVILVACAALIAGGAYWYEHPALPKSIHIWPETADGFSYHGKSVRREIHRALHGSDADVLRFISYSRYTDGAGGYGFGDVLVSVAQEIGDERFARILPNVPADQHYVVWLLFEAGGEYRIRSRPLSDGDLHRQFPKTMQILDEWKPKT